MQLVDTENGSQPSAQGADINNHASGCGRAMEDEIRRFLADIFFLGEDPMSLFGSQSLIEAGIIDSTGVLELVGFLEEQYEILIDDHELLPENLDSIDQVVHFVTRKRAAA